jgi:hypothetical protein
MFSKQSNFNNTVQVFPLWFFFFVEEKDLAVGLIERFWKVLASKR